MKNKKGFTLVELLAVIVVLAIVMLVVADRVGDAMLKSRGNALALQVKVLNREVEKVGATDNQISTKQIDKIITDGDLTYLGYTKAGSVLSDGKVLENDIIVIQAKKGSKFSNIAFTKDIEDLGTLVENIKGNNIKVGSKETLKDNKGWNREPIIYFETTVPIEPGDGEISKDGENLIPNSSIPIIVKNVIPEGGVYYIGVTDNNLNPQGYNVPEGKKLVAGQMFPKETKYGDVFVYQGYEFRYKKEFYRDGWNDFYHKNDDGWGVRVLDDTLTSYNPIPTSINGKNIVSLHAAFELCKNLIVSPKIPNTVTIISYAYNNCIALKEVPEIPDSVVNLAYAFQACNSITSVSKLPPNTYNLNNTFRGCINLETVPDKIPGRTYFMQGTFYDCRKLKKAPYIPASVWDLLYTFGNCYELEGEVVIDANAPGLSSRETFRDTKKPITLSGNCPLLEEMAKPYANVTIKK